MINIQLVMTGQDKQRVFRGYQEKLPHLDIFYQFICYLLSELSAGGWGRDFESK